jgi:hypothetical protein
VLLLTASVVAATASGLRVDRQHAVRAPTAARCGGQLWRMKTMSDIQRRSVRLVPSSTTIGAISRRPYPRPTPRRRRTNYQRQDWQVVAQVTNYRMDSGGIRLILFDAGLYVNAVIPAPSCLTARSRGRAAIVAAWRNFVLNCGTPRPDWQPLGAVMYVSGVGFWSQKGKPRRGAARNGAELHPVTGFRVVAGC